MLAAVGVDGLALGFDILANGHGLGARRPSAPDRTTLQLQLF